jgi:Uma2 family endonuclease
MSVPAEDVFPIAWDEEESSIRHEYLDGEIYAMAGGSPDHAALAAALISVLQPRLPRGCRAFTSDLRIRITATGLSRGEKLRHYKQLASVRHVVIVSHREPWLSVHRREASGWTIVEARQAQVVALPAIAAEIAVDEVYRDALEDAD